MIGLARGPDERLVSPLPSKTAHSMLTRERLAMRRRSDTTAAKVARPVRISSRPLLGAVANVRVEPRCTSVGARTTI